MSTLNKVSLNGSYREMFSLGPTVCICEHSESVHANKCTGVTGNNFERNCKCKKYRPKDNLLYLEKEYERAKKNGR